jgi:hypothetical protein
MYPLAYERCLRNVIAAEGRRTTTMSRGWASLAARLLRPLLPWPLQRGIAAFMLATLGRSHTHRFLLGLYAGLAFLLSLPLASRGARGFSRSTNGLVGPTEHGRPIAVISNLIGPEQ